MAELIAAPRAAELLARMAGRRVVVVGDVMIDEWIWGDVRASRPRRRCRSSRCAITRSRSAARGTSRTTCARSARAVAFVGGVGDDAEGARLRALFDDLGVDARGLITLTDRPTTRKTRVVAHNQQVVRADWESTAPLRDADRARVVEAVARQRARCATRSCSATTRRAFCTARSSKRRWRAPVVVADPKPENVQLFAGVTCIAPNVAEAARASGIAIVDDASLERAARALLEHARAAATCWSRAASTGCRCSARDGDAFRRSGGRAHGVRRLRRGRYGRRGADARARREHPDRDRRRSSRTSPPARSSRSSAPRPRRRPRSSR